MVLWLKSYTWTFSRSFLLIVVNLCTNLHDADLSITAMMTKICEDYYVYVNVRTTSLC